MFLPKKLRRQKDHLRGTALQNQTYKTKPTDAQTHRRTTHRQTCLENRFDLFGVGAIGLVVRFVVVGAAVE